MGSPRNASASVLIFRRTIALSSWGVYDLFSIVTLWSVPILRLICITVRSGFRTAWRFAGSPTRICPSFVNAITDGNILPPYVEPSALGMIFGVPPSMYAASEFVVPRSIPMILGIVLTFLLHDDDLGGPQDLSLEVVPLPDDLLHDAVRRPRVVHLLDALVEGRGGGGTRGGGLLGAAPPASRSARNGRRRETSPSFAFRTTASMSRSVRLRRFSKSACRYWRRACSSSPRIRASASSRASWATSTTSARGGASVGCGSCLGSSAIGALRGPPPGGLRTPRPRRRLPRRPSGRRLPCHPRPSSRRSHRRCGGSSRPRPSRRRLPVHRRGSARRRSPSACPSPCR